jgi:hypothetical protein
MTGEGSGIRGLQPATALASAHNDRNGDPGDKVMIEFSPLRDPDRQGGALKKLTLVDTGVVLTANIRAQEQPALE